MRLTCRYPGKALRSARALVVCALIAQAGVFVSGPARAETADDFTEVSREIPKLAMQGEMNKATALAERYVADARAANGEDDPEYATALSWLGWLYQKQDRTAEAAPLLEQALIIREKAFGPDHPLIATSLNNLAAVYYKQDREAEAKAMTARANKIRTKAVGLDVLEAFPRRFMELQWSGEQSQAASLARRYVAMAKERYGADQPGVVPALLEAATLFELQGNVPKAEGLLKQTLKIRTEAFGPRSPEVADSALALGRLYAQAGRDKQAERMLKRALSIRKAVYGDKDEKFVEAATALGGLYQKMGRTEEAEKLFAQSRKMRRRFALEKIEPTYAVVKVYYATDRKNTGATDPAEVYGGDRGPLTFGFTTVSIPRDHRAGVVETPSIWRLEWCNDPERFVVLLSVDELKQAQFFEDVSARVRDSAGKSAFIFVHGYNVTFTDAARRTAQMAYDLGFDGAPVFYSWPSQASYASYKVDETNAEWSRLDFKSFLKDFAAQSDAENIYLIAHSMGTRVLTGALKELVLEDPSIRDKFDEIILAAPDIDADTFKRDIAPRILAGEAGTTLYASSGDYALMASKTFAGYRRAGDTAGGVTIAPGVDTIDASAIRTDFVGHSYYADSDSVLGDLRDLLLHGKRPDKRSRLSPMKSKDGRYWTFTEDQVPAP
jgi:esterase/lipase superfamily enzyme/Tfp pilus assembly protein PilF